MNAFPPETRTTLGLTRAATETLLCRLLAKTYTNVRFISGTVLGVDAAVDRVALDAVRYRPVSEANESETVQAALVVGNAAPSHFLSARTDQCLRLLWSRQRWARLASTRRVLAQERGARGELSSSHALHDLCLSG
jgi:hypothetical protein